MGEMELHLLENIRPYVRMAKIQRLVMNNVAWVHSDNTLTYVDKGEAVYSIDGTEYRMKEGDVVAIAPGTSHHILSTGKETLVQYIIHFDLFGFRLRMEPEDPWNDDEHLLAGEFRSISLTKRNRAVYKSLFTELRASLAKSAPLEQNIRCAIVLKLLTKYLQQAYSLLETEASKPGEKHSKSWIHIERAMKYIQDHVSDPNLNNSSVGKEVGITSNYLTSLFTKHMDISLHEYIIERKLEEAKRLLLEENHTISEAALEVGFSDVQVFSKTFKRKEEITPKEFLKGIVYRKEDAGFAASTLSRDP